MNDFAEVRFSEGGRVCRLCVVGDAGGTVPLVVMPGGDDLPELLAFLLPHMEKQVQTGLCTPFALACFVSEDWNRDFSPWPAPPLFAKEEPFEGRAAETLHWVTGQLLPAVKERLPAGVQAGKPMLLGYSLAGLFSLWALLQSTAFSGCACCSGSLWYDGWPAFLQKHQPPDGSRVYLSLGDAEEKARNPRMAAVGDNTRQSYAWLRQQKSVAQAALVWHSGGHFKDVSLRMAQGLGWLVQA